jgi:transcriptional regulator with XRE-family HTH domain
MRYRHALGEAIHSIRIEKSLTLREVSQRGSLSLGHLSELERGIKETSSELLEAIARGLDVPLYQIIIEAGYRLGEYEGAFNQVPEDFAVDKKV